MLVIIIIIALIIFRIVFSESIGVFKILNRGSKSIGKSFRGFSKDFHNPLGRHTHMYK